MLILNVLESLESKMYVECVAVLANFIFEACYSLCVTYILLPVMYLGFL